MSAPPVLDDAVMQAQFLLNSESPEDAAAAILPMVDGDAAEAKAAVGNAQAFNRAAGRQQEAQAEREQKSEPAQQATNGRSIQTISAADIAPKPVRWLWDGRIPRGMLSALAGEEGLGKSQASIALAAQVTRGELDGGLIGRPASVLIAATEDAVAEVIVPRLIAAKADLKRVAFVTVKVKEHEGSLKLPDDAGELGRRAANKGAALVIIDPLSEYLDKGVDSHKDSAVRGALGPLADAAQRHDFAVLSIMHTNKGNSTKTRKALMGSVAFRSAARSVLVFGTDPDDPEGAKGPNRVLALDKHNLGTWRRSLRMKIVSHEFVNAEGERVETSYAALGEKCAHSAEDVLAAGDPGDTGPAPKAAEARTFLAARLPMAAAEVQHAAEAAGISPRTLERVKADMGVVSERDGFRGGWVWRLPEQGADL